jgi:hypothetical protein
VARGLSNDKRLITATTPSIVPPTPLIGIGRVCTRLLLRLSLFPLGRLCAFAQGFVIGRNELDMTHTKRLREVV